MNKLCSIDKEKIKKFFCENKKLCLVSILLIISFIFIVKSGNANNIFVIYDNSNTGLQSIEVGDAINEIYSILKDQDFTPKYNEIPSTNTEIRLTIDPNGGKYDNKTEPTVESSREGNEYLYLNPEGPKYIISYNDNNQSASFESKPSDVSKQFDRWILTGGGTLVGNRYIFGSSDGTITATYKQESEIFNLPTITKEGYVCKWAKGSASGSKFNGNDSIYITDNTIFYAVCDESLQLERQYTITYNLDGGTNYIGAPTTYSYGTGVEITGIPTKEGYTYNSWRNVTDNGSWKREIEIEKTATGDKIIEVKWCQNCSNVSNGSCSLNPTVAGTCIYTTSCNEGYQISGNGTYNPTCTLIKKYTVTFNSNGGSNVFSQTLSEGSKLAKPSNPTKSNYDFAGWFKDIELKNEWNFLTDVVNVDITLYAKWVKKQQSTNSNTESGSSNSGGTNSGNESGSSNSGNTNSGNESGSSNSGNKNSGSQSGLSNSGNTNSGNSKNQIDVTDNYIADEEKTNKIKDEYFSDAKDVYYYEPIIKDNDGKQINKPGTEIEYIVPIPSEYENDDSIFIYEIVDGKKREIPYEIKNGKLVFKMSSGGNFAVVIYPKVEILANDDSDNSVFVSKNLVDVVDQFEIKEVSEKDKENIINKYFKDAKDIFVVDANIYDKDYEEVDLDGESVTYKIKLPSGFTSDDNIRVYNINNGNKEELNFEIDDKYIYIKSTTSGRFAVVKYPMNIVSEKKNSIVKPVIIVVSILVIGGVGISLLILKNKKKEVL